MSGRIFVTSDSHFAHIKPFLFEPRGFSSIQEMNEEVVTRWNLVVDPEDTVYHLGDIALSDTEAAIPYIKRLNGKILWIRGNHDSDNRVTAILASCPNVECIGWATVIKEGKWRFYLSHYPTCVGNYDDEIRHNKLYCLCGHTHTKDRFLDMDKKCYHVELDAHNCYPVLLTDIIDDIKQYNEEHQNGVNGESEAAPSIGR